MVCFCGVCIVDKQISKGFGTSAHFELPLEITNRLSSGEELGYAMNEIMRTENTKQKEALFRFLQMEL